jgi:phage tail-like protein
MEIPGPLPIVGNPPLGFRFAVLFFAGGVVPNPLDILFQKVSGLGATVNTIAVEEGGQNLYSQPLPQKVQHENLVLERGLVVGSPLAAEFNAAHSLFQFRAANVLVNLLDNTRIPIASWLFLKAYPVRWSISDLDADSNAVVIERLELAYQQVQSIRL